MMDEKPEVERIFNRQYERMKKELLEINIPMAYLTIVSKYWDFAKMDIEGIMEDGRDNTKKQHRLSNF